MTIQVFATLRAHFEPVFELDGTGCDIRELKARLLAINAEAAGLLDRCRFAVGDSFIDTAHKLKENDTVFIIPPGSGG